tara:strand:+ start:23629 stop:24537 length:909 start_codon:yes stop_codon:yes gene_type:complete
MGASKPLVIVVLGPTASGKTSLAIKLAEILKLNIHNIDSRQLYIGMDIGTAKPTKEQQLRVKHYLLNLCHPNEPITLHEFKEKASFSLKKSLKDKDMGILVGGSGLYLKALTGGLEPPSVGPQKSLRNQLKKIDQIECHRLLECCDPITAAKVAPSDSVRTIRALEVFYATGKPISTQQKINPPNWNLIELGLDPQDLNERISKRTHKMFENGLIEETERLIKKYGINLPLLKTIGYQEALYIIKGKITTSEAIAITNQRTKNFAKRQRTWFKKQHSPKWLNDQEPFQESIALIQEVIASSK